MQSVCLQQQCARGRHDLKTGKSPAYGQTEGSTTEKELQCGAARSTYRLLHHTLLPAPPLPARPIAACTCTVALRSKRLPWWRREMLPASTFN